MPGIKGTRVTYEDMLTHEAGMDDVAPLTSRGLSGQWRDASILLPFTHGDCCAIWAYAVIEEDVALGDAVVIGSHCFIGRGTQIGHHTHLQSRVFVPRHARIGAYVFIGPGVLLCDDKYPVVNTPYLPEPPIIADHVSIGAGAIILPGVILYEGCQVGAGAVVTRDVPAGALVYGNPARQHKRHSHG